MRNTGLSGMCVIDIINLPFFAFLNYRLINALYAMVKRPDYVGYFQHRVTHVIADNVLDIRLGSRPVLVSI